MTNRRPLLKRVVLNSTWGLSPRTCRAARSPNLLISRSEMSSSVAGRPRWRESLCSQTRVLRWYSHGKRVVAIVPDSPSGNTWPSWTSVQLVHLFAALRLKRASLPISRKCSASRKPKSWMAVATSPVQPV
jgi:hypothetical protein